MKYMQRVSMVVLSFVLGLFLFSAMGGISLQAAAQSPPTLTINVYPGEVIYNNYIFLCNPGSNDISVSASASGTAASWASPQILNFGNLAPGDCSPNQYYTVSVPTNAQPGQTYDLTWSSTVCSGTCSSPIVLVVIDLAVTPQFPFGSIIAIIAPLSALGLYFGAKHSILGRILSSDELKNASI